MDLLLLLVVLQQVGLPLMAAVDIVAGVDRLPIQLAWLNQQEEGEG